MKILTLLVGPPGSGKSTYALERISYSDAEQENPVVYINQDLQGKDHLRIFNEAIESGRNIVVDRMNFSKSQRDRYLVPAKTKGYETQIIVLHESYETCFKRCQERKDHLTIKDETSARSALNTFFTKYERVSDYEADQVFRAWPEGEKPSAVVVDLDGTLCNVEHRRHFVIKPEGQKKDWQGFFKGMVDDTPNQWCADIVRLMADEHTVVYCSGRPDNYRKETVEWLKKYGLYSINFKFKIREGEPHLYMRPRNDSRSDNIVKEILLDYEILTRFKPYFMIDDRQQVVDMYRSRGFTVLQCDKGDF